MKKNNNQHEGDIHLRRHEPPYGGYAETTLGAGPALRLDLRRAGPHDRLYNVHDKDFYINYNYHP